MSVYKQLILDDTEYCLVPKDDPILKKEITLKELASMSVYSERSLYQIKEEMTEGVHFNRKNGKIIFDAVKAKEFLLNRNKGEHRESKQRVSVCPKEQSVSSSEFIRRWKETQGKSGA